MENEIEGRPAGNNAVMRKALKDALELLESDDRQLIAYSDTGELMDIIRPALGKPPRNCDRFGDELDAQLAFLNEEWLISVDRDSMLEKDKFENWTDQMRSDYARWLMATAKGARS